MKIVFASDSFKGSLTNEQINEILSISAQKVFDNVICEKLLIADGGEGTLDSLVKSKNGKIVNLIVNDPLYRKIMSRYGVFDDTAIISMNEASGLTLLSQYERNPLNTSTYGTGELIKDAILNGYKNIIITIGGSATNDGGIGALTALGVKFVLDNGSIAKGKGCELNSIVDIDMSDMIDISDISFTVLCDVINPLLGQNGATSVFSKQKGASDEMIIELEKGMIKYSNVVKDKLGVITTFAGGGAAGGLGFALKVFLKAKIQSGIETILDLIDFDKKIINADFVITGEGRIDSQSVDGKVISGILNRTKKQHIPTIAIVGSVGEGAEKAYDLGLNGIYSIIDNAEPLENIIENSAYLYSRTAESIFRTIKSIKE